MTLSRGLRAAALLVATTATAQPSARPTAAVASLDHSFQHVVSVRELSDGRVFVVDLRDRALLLGDWESRRASVVGRSGDGPGEYRAPGQVLPVGDDSSLIYDFADRRLTLLHREKYVRSLDPATALRITAHGPPVRGVDRFGGVLLLAPITRPIPGHPIAMQREGMAESTLVIRARVEDTQEDTIARIGGRFLESVSDARETPSGRMTFWYDNPFAVEEQAWLASDGWVAVLFRDPYRVEWRTPAGRWLRASPPISPRVPATPEEREFATARAHAGLPGGPPSPAVFNRWPPFVPEFEPNALFVTENGLALVARRPTTGSGAVEVDVFDRSGARLRTLRLPPRVRVVGIGREVLFAVESDEDGLETLRRFSFPGWRNLEGR